MFLLKICSQNNDLNTIKIVFCDVIRCAIWVFNFTLLKSSFKIYYVPNEQSIYKMSPSFNELSPIINIRSNFHCWKTEQNINILWWLLCAIFFFFFFFFVFFIFFHIFFYFFFFFFAFWTTSRKFLNYQFYFLKNEKAYHVNMPTLTQTQKFRIIQFAVSYRAICKTATCYRAICKIANFYRLIWKIAVLYCTTCKIAGFYCAICKIVVSYYAIFKIAVSYGAICKIAT